MTIAAQREPDGPTHHRYVSLTTFRRDGTPVASPVWIAALDDGAAGVSTGADSGKVKRLAHTDRVELRPCDVQGRVPDGAPTWHGTATVVTGDDAAPVREAILSRYGLQMQLIELWGRLRGTSGSDVGVVIRPTPDPAG